MLQKKNPLHSNIFDSISALQRNKKTFLKKKNHNLKVANFIARINTY